MMMARIARMARTARLIYQTAESGESHHRKRGKGRISSTSVWQGICKASLILASTHGFRTGSEPELQFVSNEKKTPLVFSKLWWWQCFFFLHSPLLFRKSLPSNDDQTSNRSTNTWTKHGHSMHMDMDMDVAWAWLSDHWVHPGKNQTRMCHVPCA